MSRPVAAVCDFAFAIGLGGVAAIFAVNDVDGATLEDLDDDGLAALGVTDAKAREKILKANSEACEGGVRAKADLDRDWRMHRTVNQVCDFVFSIDLASYAALFAVNDVDGARLEAMDDAGLLALGIHDGKAREKILRKNAEQSETSKKKKKAVKAKGAKSAQPLPAVDVAAAATAPASATPGAAPAAAPAGAPAAAPVAAVELPPTPRPGNAVTDLKGGDMAGFLRKDSGRKWQERFCVLHQMVLYYFKDAQDTKPRGQLVVAGCTVGIVPHGSEQNTFYIWRRNMKTYWLAADTPEEAVFWVEALCGPALCQRKDEEPELTTVDVKKGRAKRAQQQSQQAQQGSDDGPAAAPVQKDGVFARLKRKLTTRQAQLEDINRVVAEAEVNEAADGADDGGGADAGGAAAATAGPSEPKKRPPLPATPVAAPPKGGAPPPPPPPPPPGGIGNTKGAAPAKASGGDSAAGSGAPKRAPAGGEGRGQLLSSIQTHNGVGALRKVDAAERPAAAAPASNSMASALEGAMRNRRVAVESDEDGSSSDSDW